MEADFAAIRDGLQRLREAHVRLKGNSVNAPDRRFVPMRLGDYSGPLSVYGSEAHAFRTHPPLEEEAVRTFEARHRITLPPEYRGFLLHVGNGGAGPPHGLFRLGETDGDFRHEPWTENDGFVGVLSEPFPHTGPWNDLSQQPVYDASREGDPAWFEEYVRQENDWLQRVYWNTKYVNGAVPICDTGCNLRQWLVVTGPEAGNVWDDLRADHGGLEPVQQPGWERVPFLRWYRSWLDEALRQLR